MSSVLQMAADIAGYLEVDGVDLHQARPFLFLHQVVRHHNWLSRFEHFLHYLLAGDFRALALALVDVKSFLFVGLTSVLRPLESFFQIINRTAVSVLASMLQPEDLSDCAGVLFIVKTCIILEVKHCKLRF